MLSAKARTIHDYSDLLAMLLSQDIVQQGGFTRTQIALNLIISHPLVNLYGNY